VAADEGFLSGLAAPREPANRLILSKYRQGVDYSALRLPHLSGEI